MKEGFFIMGRCRVIVTRDKMEEFPNGAWHLSISTRDALPSYKEMKAARYKYLPDDIWMAEVLPPSKHFVNIHNFTRHLYQIDINNSNYKKP